MILGETEYTNVKNALDGSRCIYRVGMVTASCGLNLLAAPVTNPCDNSTEKRQHV
jgi:hypothetical protein